MTVTYKLTVRDMLAFNFYHAFRSPAIIGAALFVLFVVMSLAWEGISDDAPVWVTVFVLGVFMVVGLAFMVASFAIIVLLTMKSSKNKAFFAECTLTLGENSFVEETCYGKIDAKWPVVQKLCRTQRFIMIFIASHFAIVVPRRAFREQTDWDSFFEYCTRKVREASSKG